MLTMPFAPQPMDHDPIVTAYRTRRERGLHVLFDVLKGRIADVPLREVQASLQMFDDLPAAGRLGVLLDPFFHQWWLGISNALKVRDSQRLVATLSELGRLLVVPTLRCHGRLPISLRVPTSSRGELRLPGTLVHVVTPFAEGCMVSLAQEGDDLVLRSSDGAEVVVPWQQLLAQGARHEWLCVRASLQEAGIEVDGTDPWIRAFLDHIQRNDPAPDHAVGDTEPVSPSMAFLERLTSALRALASTWPEMHREVLGNVRLIVPFQSSHKWSFTNTAMLGAMYLHHGIEDIPFLVETIVHETSHLRLNMYMELEKVHEHGEHDRLSSPFRAGPRPISGLYHGVFVFTRIAEAMARLHRSSGDLTCAKRAEATLDQARKGIAELDEHVLLTPAGRALRDQITLRIEQLTTGSAW